MASPCGEEGWLAYVDESVRNANDLEKRVNTVEVYKRAVGAEPGSLRLWLAYCNYFWSLWADSQSPVAGWSEEEQMMGRELFSFGTALDLWQQGYEAIKYRIADSHLLWDRWVSLEMGLLAKTRTPEGVRRITHLYRNRLLTPHMTWDETSQAFSGFLNEYNRSAWEESMKETTANAQEVKRLITARDPFELKLKRAARSGDAEAEKQQMMDYLEWEMRQSKRNNDNPEIAMDLCRGLYARALTGHFATDDVVWHEYVVFLSSSRNDTQSPAHLLDILRRAVQHCPWSGQLWNRYILCAEEAKLPFSDVESIKHAATSEDQLYKNGMESMIEMYMAWCGFLKRTAMDANAGDEAVDVADVGLAAALEDVAVVGKRLYGKDFQGDPKFRLERIYIQYLTEKKGAIEDARAQWNKLASAQVHADNHDFWFRYYMWEMLIFSSRPHLTRSPTPQTAAAGFPVPTYATTVLSRAVSRTNIDWPEKVLEVYLQHCNDYEPPASVRTATDRVHKVNKEIRRRREQEQREKEAAYVSYYGATSQAMQQPAGAVDESLQANDGKRKRDETNPEGETDATTSNKRHKNGADEATISHADAQESSEQSLKRDRENTTVLVQNLPADVTHGKVKQYFKDYGHINNITALVKDHDTAAALIEFSSPEEAQSALLRDAKYYGENQIRVTSGHNLTVYVTNYPPTADENYIRKVFEDCGKILSIRWPSLKVNTHRRFCYVSFCDQTASAKAVQKEGTVLEDKYRLVAKYSDPTQKKNRQGALAEGREVYITNLDRNSTEADLRDIFSKYGTVTRVNIPQTMAGKNRGFAYLDFDTKEHADKAAAELNNTKFKSQILTVEISKEVKVKPTAKAINANSDTASPAPSSRDAEGDEKMGGNEERHRNPTGEEIASRTIALMGLPDTINDARVRALVEKHATIVQLVSQPSHGGAKIEFADAATAGKVALQLDGADFEGYTLRTGSPNDLRHAKPAPPKDSNQKKAAPPSSSHKQFMPQQAALRRPALGKGGAKRGLGFVTASRPKVSEPAAAVTNGDGKRAPKSNADFKAMFLSSKKPEEDKKEKGDEADREKEAGV